MGNDNMLSTESLKHILPAHKLDILSSTKKLINNSVADWKQNDFLASNYIKNRPFYADDPVVTCIFDESIDCSDNTALELSNPIILTKGAEYKVIFNGTEYNCVTYIDSWDEICIGNIQIARDQGYERECRGEIIESNEPFFIASFEPNKLSYFITNITGIHNVTIYEIKLKIHKIDTKYLPDTVGKNVYGKRFKTDIESENGEIITEVVKAGYGAEIFNDYDSNIASGKYSHAEGHGTTASGDRSHAEGYKTTASGDDSHAEGYDTTASGYYSHAEGVSTKASGTASHAEGDGTTASGYTSHAEGDWTTASGGYSHAEGYRTTASGGYSHAEGSNTTASGQSSHAEGNHTTASGKNQHVQGKFNIKDSNNIYQHIVGNGTSDTERSNAHTVDWEGNAWFAGDVYVGSTSGTNKDEGSKKLAKESDVILSPTNATVGQTIVVSAVDDNGKPTAWEAVDGSSFVNDHNTATDAHNDIREEINKLNNEKVDKTELETLVFELFTDASEVAL